MKQKPTIAVPKDFAKAPPRGPFMTEAGPLWRREQNTDGNPTFGFIAEKRHTNGLGFVHGGFLAALLDNAMAQAVSESSKGRLVTEALSVKYQHAVFPNRWIEISVKLDPELHNSRQWHASAILRSRGAQAVSANAIYKTFPRA